MNNYYNLGEILDIGSRSSHDVERILADKYYRAYLLIREYINKHAQMRREDFDFLNAQLDMLEDLIDKVKVKNLQERTMVVKYIYEPFEDRRTLTIPGKLLYSDELANNNQVDLL